MLASIACLSLFAGPAFAQTISLHPGETVTIRLDAGKAIIESRVPARPISDYETYLVRRAQLQVVPPGASSVPATGVYREEIPVQPTMPLPQRVQLTFREVPALESGSPNQSALILANGYTSSFRYRAVMRSGINFTATDVCEIRPGQMGVEHWPFVIDQLDISDSRLEAWNDQEIRCE
jgi:hypothetical protein